MNFIDDINISGFLPIHGVKEATENFEWFCLLKLPTNETFRVSKMRINLNFVLFFFSVLRSFAYGMIVWYVFSSISSRNEAMGRNCIF